MTRIALLVLFAISGPIQAADPSIDELTAQSQFIFQGKIVKMGATTVHTVAVNQTTAIVHVDDIIESTEAFRDLLGKDITIALKNPTLLHNGDKRTFFTTSWLFADSVAVREIGDTVIGRTKPAFTLNAVESSRARVADARLSSRMQSADQVVQGEVTAIAPLDKDELTPHSEHDPQWWLATIHPTEMVKGQGGADVVVAYPNSTDVAWVRAPKFWVGEKAIWILHSPDIATNIPPGHLTALDPADVQPVDSVDRVRALSK